MIIHLSKFGALRIPVLLPIALAIAESGLCDEAGLLQASRAERSLGVILGEDVPPDAAFFHAAWFAWYAMRGE